MRNISKFLWFAVFLTVAVLGSGLALRPQEQTGEDRAAPIVKSQDASSAQSIPDWVKEVRRLRSIGDAETARQILRQNSPAEVYAGDSGPLTPADPPQVFEESAGKTPDGLLQWQDNDIPVFSSSETESRPDLAVTLDTATSDIYAIAEKHSTSSSTGFNDLVLRASPDNGRTWGAVKTISHTTSDYRWPRISQIGSGHLGVAFEEFGSTFTANLMAINISNFDDLTIWRLDSDTSRTEIRPVIASDVADYPGAPYIYAAYVSVGKDANGDDNTWVCLKRSENGGQTWTSRIHVQYLDHQCPDITIALAIKGDVLYCAYTMGGPYSWAGNYHIYVRRSLDYGNTWSAAAAIANTSAEERFPRIAAADDGRAVCVYQRDGSPGGAYYAYTQDGGDSWITDILLATTVEPTSCPEVKATVPAAFFYVSYFDTYTKAVHLKRAPYADPNASAWTYLGNAKTTANALPGDQTPALLAKIHPNGGFGGAMAWRAEGSGGDIYFDAQWMPAYSLSLTKTGAGTGNVRVDGKLVSLPVTGNYFSGAEVDLEAVPDAGSSFDGWGGDLFTKLNPATVTMNANKSISAGFVVASASVTVTTSPAGRSITVDGTPYTAPHSFNWAVGSEHTIATSSPQSGAAGTRYVYSSWSDGGAQSHTISAPSSATTYTANFNTQYQLTTSVSPAAGGSISLNPTTIGSWYPSGDGVQLTANPTGGYSFVGWTGAVTGYANPQMVYMSAPKSVTANFSSGTTSITVQASDYGREIIVDGIPYSGGHTFSWAAGSVHTIATYSPQLHDYDPERYIFTGWSDGGAISHSITTPAIATTYTANFVTQKFLELYVEPASAGTITATPPSADGYYNVGTPIQLQANPAAGYGFKNWTGDLTGSANPAVIVLNYWHTITANFAAPTSVTVTTSPAGLAIMVDGTPYTSPHGFTWGFGSTHAIATASPQSEPGHPEEPQRYKFTSWSDGGGISHSITTPASTVTYTATFAKQYPLAFSAEPPGTGTVVATPSSADSFYNAGQSVQLQANPAAGYAFTNWSGDLTGAANPQAIVVDYAKSVTANFGAPAMVRLSLTGGGTGTGQIDANSTFYDLPASVMYAAGSTANLQAEPANGSVFVRWEGDLTGTTNPTSILLTAAKTVKAIFALDYRQAKVMVDFAAVGLWMKQGGSWLQLSGVDSDKMVAINVDNDPEQETLGDFGTLGVWLLDNGFWTQVSGVNPDSMAAVNIDTDPEEEAAVDFAALGLWLWNAGTWTQLSGVNPDGFIGADADGNGADEIIGDFGAIGLWRWDGAAWTAISLNNVETLAAADGDADGAEEVFGDFGAVGLWIWDGTWSQASTANAQGLLAADMDGDGDQEVFADFGTGGLMVWNSGSWSVVSALDPDGMVAANLEGDATKELVIDFGTNGLRRWSGGTEVLLTGANVEDVIAADMDGDGVEEIVGDFGALGLWYLPPTNLWEQWSGVNSQGIAAVY